MLKILILVISISALLSWFYMWYMRKKILSIEDTKTIKKGMSVAYFAGGCFWCVESDFEKLDGVKEVISGFMGGKSKKPSYEQVSSGKTKHRESVKVVYDPKKVTYKELVLYLLKHTDPTDSGGSFVDRGRQYTSAVYHTNNEEKDIAKSVIKEINERKVFEKPIVTSIERAREFWIADEHHQDYYKKNPIRYKYYRKGSGRDDFIESMWSNFEYDNIPKDTRYGKWDGYKKPKDEELKSLLTPLQYEVTQKNGTEMPFKNKYWDKYEEGIYVDIVSGEPLFSSTDKFNSETGWPSFLKPIDKNFTIEKKDRKLIVPRIEIRSKYADSHLGHIIMDGPIENNKIRYCMNSASLYFIPKSDMKKYGFGEYLYLFDLSK
jgi:peptide methionine sulfoxide reductase msrA/msrB